VARSWIMIGRRFQAPKQLWIGWSQVWSENPAASDWRPPGNSIRSGDAEGAV